MSQGFLPPVSNTGVNEQKQTNEIAGVIPSQLIETRIDWLQGSLSEQYLVEVIEFLAQIINTGVEFFQVQPHGSRWYKTLTYGPNGIAIESGHRVPTGLMCLTLKGDFWESIDGPKQKEVIDFFYSKEFRPTRLDLDCDDYGWRLSPELVIAHCSNIESWNVAGFRRTTYKTHSSYDVHVGREGYTVQFGNRGKKGGLKQVIFYDKAVESGGQMNCCRVELRLYDLKAKCAFELLAQSSLEKWPALIMGFIKGAISFYNPVEIDGEIVKEVCDWWAAIFNDYDSWSLPAKRRNNPTFARAINYIRKQVMPTFAMVMNVISYLGEPGEIEAFFYQLWFDGCAKMNDKQKLVELSMKSQFDEGWGWDLLKWSTS